jgi:DNA-binding phage protein
MKKPVLGLDRVIRMLRGEVRKIGTQAEFARETGVRATSLNSTVTGKMPPTKDVLRALNLQKVFAYETTMKGRKPSILRLDDTVKIIRHAVERAGGQAEFARKTGVNRPNLNSALLGKRPPTNDVLRALKLGKIYAYEPVAKRRVKSR